MLNSSDLEWRLSGGAGNSNPALSLGGAMSATAVDLATTLHNLWDMVSGLETAAGDVEYRCIYLLNKSATNTAYGVAEYLAANTGRADTFIALGLGTSGISGTEQVIADENTAPAGVTFSAAPNLAAAVSPGDLAPGARHALWLRRTVVAGAAAVNVVAYSLAIECDSAE
ncbi:MAG: hypothetical protein JNM98_06040 [Rhodocyclaceae bacterium]|nr:hypothetical protein [Rhodocyclaceae bacterium]